MGRQHTTYISDETWDRLKNIPGKSVSKKIANAVKYADPDHQMIQKSNLRALARLKSGFRTLAKDKDELFNVIDDLEYLIFEADMEELE